jgi:hypothetical protein
MEKKSTQGYHEPDCVLAHDIVNKLSVIIGNCDLLSEQVQPGSEFAKRLRLIHDVAQGIARELNEHQVELTFWKTHHQSSA